MERVELKDEGQYRWYSIAYCANYKISGFATVDSLAREHPSPMCEPVRVVVYAINQTEANKRIRASVPACLHGARKILDNIPQFDF